MASPTTLRLPATGPVLLNQVRHQLTLLARSPRALVCPMAVSRWSAGGT